MFKICSRLILLCAFALFVLDGTSCQLQQVPPEEQSIIPPFSAVALVGFRPGLSSSQSPGMIRSPISGAVFNAEPVPEQIAEALSNSLFKKLNQAGHTPAVSPREAAAAFSRLASSHPTWTDREIYVQIGKSLSTEAVLAGHVYRWHERQGTDYAASRPASVAFDIYLMSTLDGGILWKTRFDKAQISLSENLLDVQTFLKAKGRWMTADELAEIGLTRFVETLPKGEKAKK